MNSKFQKRHYVAIADVLAREIAPVINEDDFGTVLIEFVRLFRSDNARFKPDRFTDYVAKQMPAWMRKAG